MKRIFTIALMLFVTLATYAQMDIELRRIVENQKHSLKRKMAVRSQHLDSDSNIVVLAIVAENCKLPVSSLKKMGVSVRGDYGCVAALSVPVDRLQAVAELDEIEYLGTDHKCTMQTNRARSETQVDLVQSGNWKPANVSLPDGMKYDGTGVLVGIVDVGIDFNHAAFRDENGNTRIRMAQIYDTGDGENPADMNAVRQTFTTPEEIAKLTSDDSPQSHGTHTSATAAGSPVLLSDGTLIQGMAPKAELVLSSMYSFGGGVYESYCMDAINSQIEYAKKVGKPIVINNSYGKVSVFTDNKQPLSRFIESVTGPGRIICFSTGNSNEYQYCIEHSFQSDNDTIFTAITTPADVAMYIMGAYVEVANSDSSPLDIKLFCVDSFTKERLPFKFYDFIDGTPIDESELLTTQNNPNHDNRFCATIEIPDGVAYDESMRYYIALAISGKKGCNVRMNTSPNIFTSMGIPGFLQGSGQNTFSIHCASDSVISVGSYCITDTLLLNNGDKFSYTGKYHHPSIFSSYGTTDYGKPVPTVLAPGEYLLSGYNAYDKTVVDQLEETPIDKYVYGYSEQFGRKSWYGWDSGTSMACPVVTGIIALWLQACPSLSAKDLNTVFRNSSIQYPEFSTYDVHSIGYGAIQAAEGLEYILSKYVPTGIENLDAVGSAKYEVGSVYNLVGQKVGADYKGIVIINGKKVLK